MLLHLTRRLCCRTLSYRDEFVGDPPQSGRVIRRVRGTGPTVLAKATGGARSPRESGHSDSGSHNRRRRTGGPDHGREGHADRPGGGGRSLFIERRGAGGPQYFPRGGPRLRTDRRLLELRQEGPCLQPLYSAMQSLILLPIRPLRHHGAGLPNMPGGLAGPYRPGQGHEGPEPPR